jgi:GNAT superfamily N-acetyltransferase
MPNPIPMVLLGRLAIDQAYQSRGLGTAVLQDAVLRAQAASRILGVRACLESRRLRSVEGVFVVGRSEPQSMPEASARICDKPMAERHRRTDPTDFPNRLFGGLLVHALSEDAKCFCVRNGFVEIMPDAMTLVLSLAPSNEAPART